MGWSFAVTTKHKSIIYFLTFFYSPIGIGIIIITGGTVSTAGAA